MRISKSPLWGHAAGVILTLVAWTATGQQLRAIDFSEYPVSAIAVDPQGNTVVAGSYSYRQCGVSGRTPYSCYHVFISKLNPKGEFIFSVAMAGEYDERASGVAVDPAGNIYVAGWTGSPDFPTTAGSLQTAFGGKVLDAELEGGGDGFLMKLSPTGELLFSTFLGGSDDDQIRSVALDAAGNIYVAGRTYSRDFPQTHGAVLPGATSAFAAKINPDGSTIQYAKILGGTGSSQVNSIAVMPDGRTFVGGTTAARDLPTTPGVIQETSGKRIPDVFRPDGFVTSLDADGNLLYSTYLGGSESDTISAIAVDGAGFAHVAGSTQSSDFPVRPDALQTTLHFGYVDRYGIFYDRGDAFAAKLDPDGRRLVYSTFLGGSRYDDARSAALDPQGDFYVAGVTASYDFPYTAGGLANCEKQGFLVRLTAAGELLYSTHLGDFTQAIAIGGDGAARISGRDRPHGADTRYQYDVLFQLDLGLLATTGPFFGCTQSATAISQYLAPAAPGALLNVYGSGLQQARVLFDGIETRVMSATDQMVQVVVPSTVIPGGVTALELQVRDQPSAVVSLPVVLAAPGVLQTGGPSTGFAVAKNEDGTWNSLANPAAPGSVVALYVTGLGEPALPVHVHAIGALVSVEKAVSMPGRSIVKIRLAPGVSSYTFGLLLLGAAAPYYYSNEFFLAVQP
ncbi:MAG TPA: SBBP repeat-containing protein [Paludibaculum sp.]